MKQLNPVLFSKPEESIIRKFVNADIRNRLAFIELETLEKTGDFAYQHPLTLQYKQERDLDRLRKKYPDRFTRQINQVNFYIQRYKSQVKREKYKDNEELQRWLEKIEQYETTLRIMQKLISQ